MYTARELFDREDYEYCKHYTDKKENWTLVKEPTKKKRKLAIMGRQCFDKDERFYEIWNGKDYLVHFDEQHNLPNNWGGFGYATEKTDWLNSYEDFIRYLESVCKHIPGYKDDCEYQMTLF